MKLESVTKLTGSSKKYKATFCLCPDGKGGCEKPQKREISFGASGYQDYTLGASDSDRLNYIARHRVNEDFEDPLTAGSLSRWILWGDSRSIEKNIEAFKKRFGV